MGLETGNYIKDLDPDWPLGSDPKSQGDDHIRLTKKTTQQSFPNVDAPVLFTAAQLNALPTIAGFPLTGLQALYDGDLDNINKNSTYQLGTVTNFPSDYVEVDSGYIITSMTAVDPDYSLQVIYGLFGANANKVWMRFESASAWSAWKLVVDGGAFPQRLAGYKDDGRNELYEDTLGFAGDADDIVVNSTYLARRVSTANLPPETGNTDWGWLSSSIYANNANGISQTYTGMDGVSAGKVWLRNKVAGVWTAWKLVVDGGAFTTRLAGYEDTGFLFQNEGDADTFLTNSTYSTGNSTTNLPSDFITNDKGYIVSLSASATTVIQILYGRRQNEYKIWTRTSDGSVWGAWKLVVDGSTMTRTGSVLTLTNVIEV